jgi:hypothetical protein
MSLMRDLDEAFLRLLSIFLRAFQIFNSLFILSAVAQVINDISTIEIAIPGRIIWAEAVACAAALYGIIIILPTCCCGVLFFFGIAFLDIVFTGLFIACAVLLNGEATETCAHFGTDYFGNNTTAPVTYDCNLMKAVFAFCVINM